MDDLSERDLSGVADQDLSAEERQEIQRRFDSFLGRMQIRRHTRREKSGESEAESAPKPKRKRVADWRPRALSRGG